MLYFILIAVVFGAVVGLLVAGAGARRARDAAQRQAAYEKALGWAAAWAAFQAEAEAKHRAFVAGLDQPEFVISQLIGEHYPRYAVFGRKVDQARVRQPCLIDYYGLGEAPRSPPPEDLPASICHYQRISQLHAFQSEAEAEEWLYLFRNPGQRQQGFDDLGEPLGPYSARDIELGR